jgi:DNA-binding NarL/FixJ family response regulator
VDSSYSQLSLRRQVVYHYDLQTWVIEAAKRIREISPSTELEVIKQIKAGRSSKEISETLDIAVKTVETHRYNILKKLQVKTAVSLVQVMEESDINI